MALTTSLSSLAAGAMRLSVVDREARQVAEQMQLLIAQPFSRAELEGGLGQDNRVALDALSADPKNGNVLRLLLWNRDGTLLYSTDRRGEGARAPLSDGLRAALAGSMAVQPLAPERLRSFSGETIYLSVEGYLEYLLYQRQRVWVRPGQQVVSIQATRNLVAQAAHLGVARMFVPVQVEQTSAPTGAFEVFYDFRPLENRLARIQQTVWTTIPGGFLALYCAMLVVVRRTSRVLTQQREDLRAAHLGTVHALATVVDARDSQTGDHSGRVASYAVAIAQGLGLAADTIAELKVAAALHDIGKIGVPDSVLMKPGPLTSAEWDLMRHHAIVGSSILESTPLSAAVKDAVRHVHERWDGGGYPDQLKGEQIPLPARILAVADAFEAMTSTRPYRRALSPAKARGELQRKRGTQFDPRVVDELCGAGTPQPDGAART
jgi:putative nucleotidyltransferase with HDIG domain